MNSMKAALVHSFTDDLVVEELPIPAPGPFEALVKVEYSGVCHTDLHAAHGDWPVKPTLPFVPGHEGVGTVVAIGDQVTRLAVGDTVGNAWLWSACGECEYCQTGWETLCPDQVNGGYSVNGSFGTHMLVDSRYAPIIPGARRPVGGRTDPVRRCHGLQRVEGDRHPARSVGADLGYRRFGSYRAVQYARCDGPAGGGDRRR